MKTWRGYFLKNGANNENIIWISWGEREPDTELSLLVSKSPYPVWLDILNLEHRTSFGILVGFLNRTGNNVFSKIAKVDLVSLF